VETPETTQTIDRRTALKLGVLGAGALVLSDWRIAWAGQAPTAPPSAGPPPLFFGVISDVHAGWERADDPLTELGWAIDQLSAVHPDFVLFPGDITDNAQPAQYQSALPRARRIVSPVYYLPGNHECPLGETEYRARFTQFTGQPPWQAVRLPGWRLILLDSVRISGGRLRHDGVVGKEQLEWLKHELAGIGPNEPIILADHHPFMIPDNGLTNADEVLALFRDHYLLYTITGHFHYNQHDTDDRGVHHFVTGALSYSNSPFDGIGYRLFSTVGNNLWTTWVETTDPAPLSAWFEAAGPGPLKHPCSIALPSPSGNGSHVAVSARYLGDGLALKSGGRTLWTLPAARQPATAVVILTEADSATLLGASTSSLTLDPVGQVSVKSVAVYRSSARWEHYGLRHTPAQ
jgi:hypothetical protein